ncbi:F0F1 ATP synthase subunit A [Mycoplasmopsis maculosa]|uniref:F0F1 ATP synthase subunit A n=1 Tax=Mycoplasmopsis maculosa TaxID=114885 RepID=A0A449B3K8_9BACT|nr:F0F1 ATP synthase subunit A [Mycoplasmopsis maculosa]VEU75155.1 F0F1 ATP synthase subunit A [Mycoplasmopsis maculosa]
MKKITSALWEWNQPQLFSLIIVVLICFILSLTTYILIKKESKPNKAPHGLLFVMEGYINYIDANFDENTEGKLPKARFYIFGISTFLFIGLLISMLGLEPIVTSYSVAFVAAFVTWLGIYITAFIYQKWRFLKRYMNPIELIGQYAPLISLSFRIFGNVIGGASIIFLVYFIAGLAWSKILGQDFNTAYFAENPLNQPWPLFAPIVTPFLHMYFDIFSAYIQTLVFCALTTVYWANEVEITAYKKKNKENSQELNTQKITLNENVY